MALEHEQQISNRRNVPRFFVEHPHISWILLLGVLIWGWFGYTSMPQRKDPDIPVRLAVAACPWPGATAQQVEQYITRRIEDVAAENKTIHPGTDADYGIKSTSLPGYSFVTIQLDEGISDTKRQFSDINLKLNALNSQLPQGAGPIIFQSDFGDTAALMLTVASPKADDIEIAARANSVEAAIRKIRDAKHQNRRGQLVTVTVVNSFPQSISAREVLDSAYLFQEEAQRAGIIRDSQIIQGSGFIGVDGVSEADDSSIQALIQRFISERLKRSELHPDSWDPAIIRDPKETRTKLASVAGDKYSYAELDNFSDLIGRTLQGAPEVSKVERRGVLSQTIYLDYSQDRLAAYGLRPADLSKVLSARNIIAPGGTVESGERRVTLIPSGQFDTAKSIGDVAISATSEGTPVYLRDLVQISRGYQAPAQYLNYYTWRDTNGHWQRSRAITLAVYMRDRKQIARFGQSVNSKLSELRQILPADLILAHTSDQPLQVKENINLFMRALLEAIILVVLVSLIGFWEWRLALIMALAIPITLAMTFGIAYMLGIDLQQVSIASLIIALGLLVDVPVVSGDGIKRHLAEGFRAQYCLLAWPDEARHSDLLRDNHECYRLPAIFDAHRQYRRVLEKPPGGDDGFSPVRVLCGHDFCSVPGLLHLACSGKARTDHRGDAAAGILWLLQQTRRQSHKTPLGGPRCVPGFPDRRRVVRFSTQDPVLSRRRPILVLFGYLVTE